MRRYPLIRHAFEALDTSVLDTPVGSLIIQSLQRHYHAAKNNSNRKNFKRKK